MGPFSSVVTSFIVWLCGGAVQWAISHGFAQSSDKSQLTNVLVGVVSAGVFAGLTWLKAEWQTQRAKIKSVNETDNGVKVVPASANAPTVTGPLK